MILDIDRIITVDPSSNTLDFRDGTDVTLVDDMPASELHCLPVRLSGIQRYDLAIFATAIDDEGSTPHPLLVLKKNRREHGQVATEELVATYPEKFVTRQLAQRVLTLSLPELDNLTMDERILRYISQRFPRMRGLSR